MFEFRHNQPVEGAKPSSSDREGRSTPSQALEVRGPFHYLSVSGDPQHQGEAYGTALRRQIGETFELYSTLFGLAPRQLIERGARVLERIDQFSLSIGAVVRGVASGSGLLPEEVAALNARTELFHEAQQNQKECTAVYLPNSSVLGQNWDWAKRLDPLMFLLRVEGEKGHSFVTLTEPGIVGKIGMNSAGIGVCLNILPGEGECDGVPVHVLLRAVLESTSLEEAREKILNARHGTASSVLVGNDKGEGFCAEIFGSEVRFQDVRGEPLIRTNHFQEFQVPISEFFDDSLPRFNRARFLLERDGKPAIARLEGLLADQDDPDAVICSPFEELGNSLGEVGTLATLVMDLKNRILRIRRTLSSENFTEIQL
ncbi:MAG: hypothetical protein KDD64_16415 [Bdellovibrionales bacterium]|nr:hypothetical protein [Bdellovibrionales bacterium]